MKERAKSPEEVFRALRDVSAPSRQDADIEAHRETIDAISRAIRRGPQRGRRFKAGALGAGALAASLLLGIGGVWGWSKLGRSVSEQPSESAARSAAPVERAAAMVRNASGTVVAAQGAEAFVVSAGAAYDLAEGYKLTTAVDSHATLELRPGVMVEVAQSSHVSIAAAAGLESRLELAMGRVALEVPKLSSGRTVVVQTPDAKVVVRGTKFVVDVRPRSTDPKATITSVEVSRGAVLVIHGGGESLLTAGESWSSAAEAELAEHASSPAASLDLDMLEPAPVPRAASAAASAGRSPDAETLTEENRLFQEALDARNANDSRKAVKLLGDLLLRFPKSPVAHEARVERFRTLAQTGDRAGAVSEATRYLQEYPRGFAANEARRIAGAEAPRDERRR